jgi:hypothetical protein
MHSKIAKGLFFLCCVAVFFWFAMGSIEITDVQAKAKDPHEHVGSVTICHNTVERTCDSESPVVE